MFSSSTCLPAPPFWYLFVAYPNFMDRNAKEEYM